MDRESVVKQHTFEAGVNSPAISTAKYAWQSLHLPTAFVGGTIQFQMRNETDGSFVNAIDAVGAAIAPIAVVAGQVLPVDPYINHARIWRFVCSAAQPAGLVIATVNKT